MSLDLATYKKLCGVFERAAELHIEHPDRKKAAHDIYVALTGSLPSGVDPDLVDRLKALNQQFSDEKNAEALARKLAEEQMATAQTKLSQYRQAHDDLDAIMQKRNQFLGHLQELRSAIDDVETARRKLHRLVEP